MTLDEVIAKYTNERDRIKRECEWDLMYPGGMSTRYTLLNEIVDDLNSIKDGRNKLLDKLMAWGERQPTNKYREMSDWLDIWFDEDDFIEELRQAGEKYGNKGI